MSVLKICVKLARNTASMEELLTFATPAGCLVTLKGHAGGMNQS